jgi:hypothetical protein
LEVWIDSYKDIGGNGIVTDANVNILIQNGIPVLFENFLYVILNKVAADAKHVVSRVLLAPFRKEAFLEATLSSSFTLTVCLAELWIPSKSDFMLLYKLLLSFKSMKPDEKKIVNAIKKMAVEFNPEQPILACAACGEMYAVERDLFPNGDKKISTDLYLVENLVLLKLSNDEKTDYCKILNKYRCIQSVYPIWTGTNDESFRLQDFFHLHPNLVDTNGRCHLCTNCVVGLKTNKLYKFCIANGFDYGDLRRLRQSVPENESNLYRDLTVGEGITLSKSRPYAIVIQVSAGHGLDINKLSSHFITFPFNGHDEVTNNDVFIGDAANRVLNQVKVQFVTSRAKFKEVRSFLAGGLAHAYVDVSLIKERLIIYDAVNERFRKRYSLNKQLEHLGSQKFDIIFESYNKLCSNFDDNDECDDIKFCEGNIMVGNNLGTTSCRPSSNGNPEVSGEQRVDSKPQFMATQGVPIAEDGSCSRLVDQEDEDELPSTSSCLLRPNGKFDDAEDVRTNTKNVLMSLKNMVGNFNNKSERSNDNVIDTPPKVSSTVTVKDPECLEPLNEYLENDTIYLESFPDLFLLGKGVPGSSMFSAEFIKHLNNQCTQKFSRNQEIQMLFFNQIQRLEASRVVARKVHNHPEKMVEAAEILNSEDFKNLLEIAQKRPEGAEAKQGSC